MRKSTRVTGTKEEGVKVPRRVVREVDQCASREDLRIVALETACISRQARNATFYT
jgi:hypothetical protein